MRIWSIHPSYLDWKGLGAQWREALLAQQILLGSTRGWKNHPQLNRFKEHSEPIKAIGFYLLHIYKESKKRNYNYDFSKIIKPVSSIRKIPINSGQIEYEFKILMNRLNKRSYNKFLDNRNINPVLPHPLFYIRNGPPEDWEISYWKEK
jgi:hypothetical protein